MLRTLMSLLITLLSSPSICFSAEPEFYWYGVSCLKFNITHDDIFKDFEIIDADDPKKNNGKSVYLNCDDPLPEWLDSVKGLPTLFNETEEFNRSLTTFKREVDALMSNFTGFGVINCKVTYADLQKVAGDDYSMTSMNSTTMKIKENKRIYLQQIMEAQLKMARDKAPAGHYGYIGCPNCDKVTNDEKIKCFPQSENENNRTSWLWKKQDYIFPGLEVGISYSYGKQLEIITEQLNVAERLARRYNNYIKKIVPMFYLQDWSRNILSEEIIFTTLKKFIERGYDQIILTRYSGTSAEECKSFHNYLKQRVGPAVIAARMFAKTYYASTNLHSHYGKMKNNSTNSVESLTGEDPILKKKRSNSQPRSHPPDFLIFFLCLWTMRHLGLILQ